MEHVVKATPAEYGAGGLATSVDLHVDAVKASLAALVARLRTIIRCVLVTRLCMVSQQRRHDVWCPTIPLSHHLTNPCTNASVLEAMQSGAVPPDFKLLRQIGSLCHRLPAAGRGGAAAGSKAAREDGGGNSEFEQAFLGEYSVSRRA